MWLSVDPLAEKYPSISPYAYAALNPVKLVDLDGMEPVSIEGPGPKGKINPSLTIQKNTNQKGSSMGIEVGESGVYTVNALHGTITSNNNKASLPVVYPTQVYSDYYQKYVNINKNSSKEIFLSTNCYGYVLTGGEYIINSESFTKIGKFLNNSGYQYQKSASLNSNTVYKTGDLLLWDGHIIEAVNKGGKLVWESYFAGDDNAYYGSLKDILYYNKEISGGAYGSTQDAYLFRPTGKPDIVDKKYNSIDVKPEVTKIREHNKATYGSE